LEGMADHLRRAASTLGSLRRFGRIAVVADQRWVRVAARLESALLPYVSYEVFPPDERERAFRWVVGQEAHPHGPALSIIDTDDPAVVGFEIDGRLTEAEIRAMTDHFERGLEAGGRLRILARVKRLGAISPRGLLDRDFVAVKRALVDRVDRYALVGGPAWLRHWVGLLDGVLRIEIRHFEADAEAEAWRWLGAQ